MSNERFCSICEKYIRFNNEFNQYLIFCDYTHEKKSSRLIFHNTYLKKKRNWEPAITCWKWKEWKQSSAIIHERFQNIKKEHIIHDKGHDN